MPQPMNRYQLAGCPTCGTTDAHAIATAQDIRNELELLWLFHTRRLHSATPATYLRDRLAFSQRPPLQLVQCTACSLLYRNPREHPETLLDTYRDEPLDGASLRALFENQRHAFRTQLNTLKRLLGRTGSGIEIGSYVGAFLDAARNRGWNFRGLDINDDAANFARTEGLDVRHGTVDDVTNDYDVVAFWNCFDQLPDPLAAAHIAHDHLRPNGILALRVPNGEFYTQWRRHLHTPLRPLATALLAHNNLLAFPYRHGFSATSIRTLLDRTGFSVVHVTGDVLVPIAVAHTRKWAAAEERIAKALLKSTRAAPWMDVFARRV